MSSNDSVVVFFNTDGPTKCITRINDGRFHCESDISTDLHNVQIRGRIFDEEIPTICQDIEKAINILTQLKLNLIKRGFELT